MALEEGDTYNAASVNAELTALRALANALGPEDFAPHALNENHIPGLVGDIQDRLASGGLTAGYRNDAANAERYDNVLEPNNTHPSDYQIFRTVGTTPPNGPRTGIVTGWSVADYGNDTGKIAQVTWGTPGLPTLTARNLAGLQVRWSIELGELSLDPYSASHGEDTVSGEDYNYAVVLGIGWRDRHDAYHCIKRSVRYFSVKSVALGRLSTMTTILQTDITGVGDSELRSIVGLVAVKILGTTDAVTSGFALRGYSLNVLPLHAGVL